MKLIIEIDDKVFEEIKKSNTIKEHLNKVDWSIRNGTPYNPSGDLISREALKTELNSRPFPQDYSTTLLLGAFNELIDNSQAVEERPQGEWIEYNATGKKQYMCSKCSMKEKNPKIARYCYWCGAKMKGGAE